MSNSFDSTAVLYRIGSVSMNAVKALREVYGRDDQPFLDADIAAIKAIELILADLPQTNEYAALEAKPIVAKTQPKANPGLKKLADILDEDGHGPYQDKKAAA